MAIKGRKGNCQNENIMVFPTWKIRIFNTKGQEKLKELYDSKLDVRDIEGIKKKVKGRSKFPDSINEWD